MSTKSPTNSARFLPGDWVEVRPFDEIRATLDAQGKCDGLPFMQEMIPYCGRRFQVFRRAEKTFLDNRNFVIRLKNMVLLEGVRCSGQSHDGCQSGCLLLWRDAWLRPAASGEAVAATESCPPEVADFPTRLENAYTCQATELVHCGLRLPRSDLGQFYRDYVARAMGIRELAEMVTRPIRSRLRRAVGLKQRGEIVGFGTPTSSAPLNLKAGEWVEVKSPAEIAATLDTQGRSRGLGFSPDMSRYCGRRFRVLRRAERIILEWSGEMRQLANTVILDGVTCSGVNCRSCPRDCYHLWRETWLKRVE